MSVLHCSQRNIMASHLVILVRVYHLCLQKESGQLGLFRVLLLNHLPHGLGSPVQLVLAANMVIEQKAIESGHFQDTASVGHGCQCLLLCAGDVKRNYLEIIY
jgi:hypothetical protein